MKPTKQREQRILCDTIDGKELSSFIDEINSKESETFDKYLIAYIDFLGMKKMMQNGNGMRSLLVIKKLLSNAKKRAELISDINLLNSFDIRVFSDNLIIAIKTDYSILREQIISLVNLISLIQFEALFQFEYTLRGGITIGELYIDDSIVWGTGLIDAYNIENTIANYPRVIIDSEVIKAYDNADETRINLYAIIKKDFDGFWYVNFYWAQPSLKLIPQLSISLQDMLRNNIYDSDRVKQKINWIIRTFNDLCIEFKDRGDFEKYTIPYLE